MFDACNMHATRNVFPVGKLSESYSIELQKKRLESAEERARSRASSA